MTSPTESATKSTQEPVPEAAVEHTAERAGRPTLRTEEIVLNMGPQHPSTHGVLHVLLTLEGEVVRSSDASIGYLHRCIEKISENRTYAQCIALMDRADYVGGFFTELALVRTLEEMAEVEIPKRAQYLRVLLCELNRISTHTLWLATFGLDLGAITPFFYCFREREALVEILESICGGRMMFNFFRVGGVRDDIPHGFEKAVLDFLDGFDRRADDWEGLLTENEIFQVRTRGVGALTTEAAADYCLTGPVLRACGVAKDMRRDQPYSSYEDFDFDVPTGVGGDCFERYAVRAAEMRQSARIARQAMEGLPEGEWRTKVPRTFKPPEGECYRKVEGPRGEIGIYVVSDGGPNPYRLKIKSPSLLNLQVLPELLRGRKMGDAVAIIGSLDIVLGEIDR